MRLPYPVKGMRSQIGRLYTHAPDEVEKSKKLSTSREITLEQQIETFYY